MTQTKQPPANTVRFSTNGLDLVALEDWRARGITPIPYNANENHDALQLTLERWAKLSAVNGKKETVDAEIRRIVKTARATAPEIDRDLFDHIIRRGNASERIRLSAFASGAKADLGWLDAIVKIGTEKARGHSS